MSFANGIGVLVGLAVGAVFFAALRANTRLYLMEGSAASALALHAGRMFVAAGGFLALAVVEPTSLLPGLLAFTVVGLVASRHGSLEGRTP